ncbi:hypothetical protein EDB85DRAFT_1894201 [Lactarius pseudohatsudake]|nr:hypothetical protein EDB85DRAFT_1894201 [Lactarius pseudohatsudake]
MLLSSPLFLSSPSSLDDTNNTDGGDKGNGRYSITINVTMVWGTCRKCTVGQPRHSGFPAVFLILMRTDILDNWPPQEEAILEDVPTPLLSTHRSTVSRPSLRVVITDNVNRLLQYTRGVGNDNATIKAFTTILGEIQNELRNLADYIHENEVVQGPALLAEATSYRSWSQIFPVIPIHAFASLVRTSWTVATSRGLDQQASGCTDISENGGNATRDADSDDHGYLYMTTAGLLLSPRPPAPVQIQLPSTGASSSELPTGCTGSCEAPSPEPSRSDATTAIRRLRECFGPIFDTATTAIMTNMATTPSIQIPSPSKSRRRQSTPTLRHRHGFIDVRLLRDGAVCSLCRDTPSQCQQLLLTLFTQAPSRCTAAPAAGLRLLIKLLIRRPDACGPRPQSASATLLDPGDIQGSAKTRTRLVRIWLAVRSNRLDLGIKTTFIWC